VDDPRTLNKTLYLRLPANTLSFNELVGIWENKIDKTLNKVYVPKEEVLKLIAGHKLLTLIPYFFNTPFLSWNARPNLLSFAYVKPWLVLKLLSGFRCFLRRLIDITFSFEKLIVVNKLTTPKTVVGDAETPFPGNISIAIRHSIFVKGDQTNFEIGPDGVEASQLYLDVKYTTVDEYLVKFVWIMWDPLRETEINDSFKESLVKAFAKLWVISLHKTRTSCLVQ